MMLSGHTEPGRTAIDVATEVATREDVDATELPPLAEYLDPDALETLVGNRNDGRVTVSFVYCGYDVTVTSDGRVTIDG